jgi:hypothetical protein
MPGEVSPRSRAARYALLVVGLVPLAELAYIAGPKVLLPVAAGVLSAGLWAWRLLSRVESSLAREQSLSSREKTESTPLDTSSSFIPGDQGAA